MNQNSSTFIFNQMVLAAKALGITSKDVETFCKENHCDSATAITALIERA